MVMQRFTRFFLLVTPLATIGMWCGCASAAGLDRITLQELVPPGSDTAGGWNKTTPRSAWQPGLKLPDQHAGRSGDVFDVTSQKVGETVFYSGTRTAQRLGSEYSQSVGGLRYPLSGSWTSTIETSFDLASPLSSRGYSLLGQVQRSLAAGWDVSLGLQYSSYDLNALRPPGAIGDSGNPLSPGLPLYQNPGGASSATGYELRFNYRYGERNTFGLSYGSGRDFDYARQLLGVYPNDGRQFGFTGQHWLTPDWALSYGLMAQEQLGLHRGQGLHLGLRYSF